MVIYCSKDYCGAVAEIKWFRVPVEEVFSLLESDEEGLTENEASARLERHGFNEVRVRKPVSAFHQFFRQFLSPLIYVLLVAAAFTFFLREWTDMSVILGVVLANAVIGFIQERKAQHAIESLAQMLVSEAVVLRGGRRRAVSSREVVTGDVVLLESGQMIPADLRLFYVKNLRVDESSLTGESLPVEKRVEPIEQEGVSLGDQRNMAFAGIFVVQGQGRGVVVATGENTELGRISRFMEQASDFSTPLLRKLDFLAKQLALVIVGIAVFTFIWGSMFGYDPVFIFLAAVSIAVAVIPESLPATVTIALATGVKKMAERNAIIRHLPSVETLGSTTVICTDKTGTLTRNQMTVTTIYTGKHRYTLTGTGYRPQGEFLLKGEKVEPLLDEVLVKTLQAGTLCNDAALSEDGIEGDSTEGAMLVAALKAGVESDLPRLDVIPFEPEKQYMATLHKLKEEENIIYVKGSPERVLSFCSAQEEGGMLNSDIVLSTAEEMASEALRTLAVAYKKVDATKTQLTPQDMCELVFLGLQGMLDPPREEAIEAIKTCRQAGIRVIMITGDHRNTALAIAHRVGIETRGVLTGAELEAMNTRELDACLDEVSVFARTSPEHKFNIVQRLQRKGEIVAVTGDGTNDAPALKTADIGIAMGKSGTQVSREAADMVLVDDNFASIVAAVEEGRDVYSKVQKIITWTLPTNGGEGLAVLIAILFGLTLPLLPLHILWINTVTAIGLGTTLIAEPREKGLLRQPPRPAGEPLLLPLIKKLILIVSLLMVSAAFVMFFSDLESGDSMDAARTMALNTIVLFEVFYLFNSKSLHEYVFKQILSNRFMLLGVSTVLLLQVLITYHPAMNSLLHTAPLSPLQWLKILLVSSSVFFTVEFLKYLRKREQR